VLGHGGLGDPELAVHGVASRVGQKASVAWEDERPR
jgi:hypothetical protein